MVCCAFIATLIGSLIWLAGLVLPRPARTGSNPLAWRPYCQEAKEDLAPTRRSMVWIPARLKCFVFAAKGLGFMLRSEANARVHLAATIAVAAAGLLLRISAADWRWLAAAVIWVWCAEAVNTSIEHLCDVVSPGPNDSVAIAKDVAAGAVLLSAIGAAIVGGLTLMPYIVPLALDSPIDFTISGTTR